MFWGFFLDNLLNNINNLEPICVIDWSVYLCPLTADVLKTLIFYINNNYLLDSENQIISNAFFICDQNKSAQFRTVI